MLLEQAGVEVEGPLAPVGLLDDRGDEVVADRFRSTPAPLRSRRLRSSSRSRRPRRRRAPRSRAPRGRPGRSACRPRRRSRRARRASRGPCACAGPSVPPGSGRRVLERLAHLGGLLVDPLRPAARARSSRSSSVTSSSSASATARRARSTLHGHGRGLAQLGDERLLVLAGGGQVLLEVHALGLRGAWRGPASRCSISALTRASGTSSSSTSSASASGRVVAQGHLGLTHPGHRSRACAGPPAARRRSRTRRPRWPTRRRPRGAPSP